MLAQSKLIGFSWSVNTYASMFKIPLDNVIYEFVVTSPVESNMIWSSNLDSLRDLR